jgi:hypothetical protein
MTWGLKAKYDSFIAFSILLILFCALCSEKVYLFMIYQATGRLLSAVLQAGT